MDSPTDTSTLNKRHSKSCQRCQRRKQRCHGFPVCSNCQAAKKACVQSQFSIDLHRTSSEFAAFERIKELEEKLATALSQVRPNVEAQDVQSNNSQEPRSVSSNDGNAHQIADTVGFLSLGDSVSGSPAYVGASSGIGLATNLGDLMRATVWRKALASTTSEALPTPLSSADLAENRCAPPDDEVGSQIIKTYFTKIHHRYPFLDRGDVLKIHASRHQKTGSTTQDRYATFKLYMVYAIGSTLLQLTEKYTGTSPERYFISAMQYISAAGESHPIHNLESMVLLVVYNLRSPSNSGIWYFIGFAMRTAIDLGLHREAHYTRLSPFQSQLRRRLFWSVYLLDRVVAVSLGRPVNIADQDIDVNLPLDIDDGIRDNETITKLLVESRQSDIPRRTSTLTMWTELVKLKRIESQVQSRIYRVDRPTSSLLPEVHPLLRMLEEWRASLPKLAPAEYHYLDLLWNKSVRLLIQPFLRILSPEDELMKKCLASSGQVCQMFKRMFQKDSYGHSFISVHSIFIAGVTICYCLCLHPYLWTMTIANDLRACSSALFVMAERTPSVRRYRDVLENVINNAQDYVTKSFSSSSVSREVDSRARTNISSHEHQAVQSLLGLSSTQDSNHPILAATTASMHSPSFEPSSNWEEIPVQSSNGSREEISNWTMEEPMFDLQWQSNDGLTTNFPVNMPIDIWQEVPDEQPPVEGVKENVWAGDRFGLEMINMLLSMDNAMNSEIEAVPGNMEDI